MVNAIEKVNSLDASSFEDMKALQDRVRAEIRANGLVVLRNFAQGGGDDAAAKMEELMIVFGGKEGMSSFGSTPMDPIEAGEGGDENAQRCQVDGRSVRRLGNTVGPDGKPTSLLAKAGYEWCVHSFRVCVCDCDCVRYECTQTLTSASLMYIHVRVSASIISCYRIGIRMRITSMRRDSKARPCPCCIDSRM